MCQSSRPNPTCPKSSSDANAWSSNPFAPLNRTLNPKPQALSVFPQARKPKPHMQCANNRLAAQLLGDCFPDPSRYGFAAMLLLSGAVLSCQSFRTETRSRAITSVPRYAADDPIMSTTARFSSLELKPFTLGHRSALLRQNRPYGGFVLTRLRVFSVFFRSLQQHLH